MNPLYQAQMGGTMPMQMSQGQIPHPNAGGPLGALQGVMERAQQLASTMQNPQQLVKTFFPDAPVNIQGDPNQLLGWLQQTGRVSPQMVQMAQQMMRR